MPSSLCNEVRKFRKIGKNQCWRKVEIFKGKKMRTKTLCPKPKFCTTSELSSNLSTDLYEDETNGECGVDGNDHSACKDTGSNQDNDNVNIGDVDGNGVNNDEDEGDDNGGVGIGGGSDDYDNMVLPDSVEERCAGGSLAAGPSKDCIVVDWLEGEFCIICNRCNGQLLVCSENSCPVAIHEVCMNGKPVIDDMGKFYCPYCWYKRALARTKELRREAMFAKTELSNFLCLKRDGVNQEKQDNVTEKVKASGVSTMEGKINADDCEKGLNDDHSERIHHNREEALSVESISKEKSDEESTSRVGDGERTQEEDIENTSDSEDDKIDEDQWRKQPSSSNHLEIVRGPRRSTEETSNVVGVLEENQGKKGNEEPGLSNAVGTTMTLIAKNATSKVPAIEHFEYVSPNLDTLDIEPLAVRAKRFKRPAQRPRPQKVDSPKNPSSQSSSSAEHEKMNRQEKATAAKDSLRCQKLTRQLMLPTLGEKRRRLNWTAEEVDMLKEGVRIFSAEANKNIPWRKILLFGHRVFHETRAPADLKDKWKNMAKAPKGNM